MTITHQFTAAPTPPSTGSPSTFPTLADAWVAWLSSTFVPELAEFIEQMQAEADIWESLGLMGFEMAFDTDTTASDPGAGTMRLGAATQNTATTLLLDDLDAVAANIREQALSFNNGSETVKGTLYVSSKADPSKRLVFNVTAAAAGAGFVTLSVACVESTTASPFADGEAVRVFFLRNGANAPQALAPKIQTQAYTYGTTGGTSTAYTLSVTPAPAAYEEGQSFNIKLHATPTTNSPTLNVNGLGAKAMRVRNIIGGAANFGALGANPLWAQAGTILRVTYNGSFFTVEGVERPLLLSSAMAGLSVVEFAAAANTWDEINMVALRVAGVSGSGTDRFMVQIGPTGAAETTGYTGSLWAFATAPSITQVNHSNGWNLTSGTSAASTYDFTVLLFKSHDGSNTWTMLAWGQSQTAGNLILSSGVKAIAGALGNVRLVLSGASNYDAGMATLLAYH